MNTTLPQNAYSTKSYEILEARTVDERAVGNTNDLSNLCVANVNEINQHETELSVGLESLSNVVRITLGQNCIASGKAIEALLSELSSLPQMREKINEHLGSGTFSETVAVSTIKVMKDMDVCYSGVTKEFELIRNALSSVDLHSTVVETAENNLKKVIEYDCDLKELGASKRLLNAENKRHEEIQLKADPFIADSLNRIVDLVKNYKNDCSPRALSEDEFNKILEVTLPELKKARAAKLENRIQGIS